MSVCGHVPAEVPLLHAAKAGQRSNEHLMQVYEACSTIGDEAIGERKGRKGQEILEDRDARESRGA